MEFVGLPFSNYVTNHLNTTLFVKLPLALQGLLINFSCSVPKPKEEKISIEEFKRSMNWFVNFYYPLVLVLS